MARRAQKSRHNSSSSWIMPALLVLGAGVLSGVSARGSATPAPSTPTPYAPENPITGVYVPTIPKSFEAVAPSQFNISGASKQAQEQAYAFYQEQLADYNIKKDAYIAAGKRAPHFSFQTAEARLDIRNLGFNY